MPDGNLRKVLRTIRQCVTRITGCGGLHSRLNQLQASLDTAQSRLRSSGIYSPPIQTALDHAKHAAFSLDAYTQTEHAWEQAIGTGSSASTTQTIDATGNDGIINSQGDASALIVNNDETVVSSSTKNKSSGGTGRPGGVRDLEPAYTGVDARRGTIGRGGTGGSGNGGGAGSHRADPPDWNDPVARQNWFNSLETKRVIPYSEAYAYQHRALATDIERELTSDDGQSIFADSVTLDGTAYTAWDAKHSGRDSSAIYEGTAPPFIQEPVMARFDDQMRTYESVIQSSGNPVNKLVVVTNTPEAQAYLSQRLQNTLKPDTPFEVQLKP